MTRVFISSTSEDLAEYRQAAIDTCNRLEMVPTAMEFFSAMGPGATEASMSKLRSADLYVGMFAHRYGYIESGHDRSVTEIEFDTAEELRLDRLCFVVDPAHPWPPDAVDHEHYAKLQSFKDRLDKSVVRAQFTTVDVFRVELLNALLEWRDQQPGHPPGIARGEEAKAEPIRTSPPLPPLLIGRGADLEKLKMRVGVGNPDRVGSLTTVRGWPGVGKTTLMATLAQEPDVVADFSDGVLWAAVGEKPEPTEELQHWAQALGDYTPMQTLEDAIETVTSLLRDRSALLIVDDVWDSDDALPFRVGGPACSTLVTTRFGGVARDLSATPDDVYLLDRLDDDYGVELLARLAPRVCMLQPGECRKLVGALEGLPLALRVAGRMLDREAAAGFDVLELFRLLSDEALLLSQRAPEDRFDPKTGTTPTIQLLLEKSTDRLDDRTREYFAYLGAFAPKPATFDLEAMRAVWDVDEVKPIVLDLVDRGLLEPIPSVGRFWMHAILVKHASVLLERYDHP